MRLKLGLAAVSLMIATSACGAEEVSTLKLTENGLGDLGSGTAYSVEAVSAALPGYAVTAENYYAEGDPYPMIVVREGDRVIAEVLPRFEMEEMVGGVVVKTADIVFDERVSLGMTYADMSVAPQDCVAGLEERSGLALCRDGKVPHVGLIFGGDYAGPDGELPPADVLATFTVQEITWSAGVL
ncbi:MAG: DUF1131 family protein [Parvibaculaceae bacterium]|nr:DUF1131 family protein [Parvibaculaceae bacterium]